MGLDTTRRMHIYLANAGPSTLKPWMVSSIEGRSREGDSERRAGGVRKSCDAEGHATLLPGGKGGFPLHRSEATHQYESVVQNMVKLQRLSRDQYFWVPHRPHVFVRRSSQGFQRRELKSLLSQPLSLCWRLSKYMMSMQISSRCRSAIQDFLALD